MEIPHVTPSLGSDRVHQHDSVGDTTANGHVSFNFLYVYVYIHVYISIDI